MGLTISEEQERYDRGALKALKACGIEGQMGECAERAYAEIDALRERVKTLEGALGVACDELEFHQHKRAAAEFRTFLAPLKQ